MRVSQFPLSTTKETPADADVISQQLMLRAGYIRRLGSGLYSWMPIGLRVLRRVEAIVREEMNRAGALEVLMPAVQPAELWQESGRWDVMGAEMLRFKDRHGRDFCFGPTHEEVITDIARRELKSYKQLPVNYYQIQTKFRDERRPRFGLMRAREFLMKDAYSFHADDASLEQTYQAMFDAYTRIFTRCGLDFRAVAADSGAIGGARSHEFHVLADSGEDDIVFSPGGFAANIELAACPPPTSRPPATETMTRLATPGVRTIEDLEHTTGRDRDRLLKTLIVRASHESPAPWIALVLRGDHTLNTVKAGKHPLVADPVELADESSIRAVFGAGPGSLGPVNCPIPVIVDATAAACADFVVGANEDDVHLTGVNWSRDLPEPMVADLRNITAGEPAPDGSGPVEIRRGIEVGHVFQLGRKYSEAMSASVLDEQGKSITLTMGCYGIGVSRVVAAAIEQHHDQHGIAWPEALAPFDVVLCPINAKKSQRVRDAAEALHERVTNAGLEVLLDDRGERPGVMFADAELIGIPHRIVVGEKGLDAGTYEYQRRAEGEAEHLSEEDLIARLIAANKAR
ncbi:MAG: proline--tRNA ligase [Thioalkalivibrionaceae bacterium]